VAIDLTDADVFFSDFAEAVIYRPHAGRPRSILAVVDREPPAFLAEANGPQTPGLHVIVRNNATEGISAAELDTGLDTIDVASRVGGEVTTRSIVRLVQQDAGLLRLEVR